jgi:E3 SUMO-protein ligase PIAS1
LSDETCARLREDPTLRLLLFGALEQPLAPYTRLDITFPSQIEVRVNGEEIKANYKGLKNKPGSTRPADITESMRTSPANFRNTVVITYALTQKASQKQEVSYPLASSSRRLRTDMACRNTTFSSTWRRSILLSS